MIEVEVKFDITDFAKKVLAKLTRLNYQRTSRQDLADLLFDIQKSEQGGWDFRRIRLETSLAATGPSLPQLIAAESKQWVNQGSNWAREEKDFEVVKIVKSRTTLVSRDHPYTVVLDTMIIPSRGVCLFLEVEALTEEPAEVKRLEKEVEQFAREQLGVGDAPKAPGYLTLLGYTQ